MFAAIRQRLKGWKTVVANALLGIPSGSYYIYMEFQGVDVTPLIPAKYVGAAVACMAVLGVILRIITTGPLGHKGNAEPGPNVKAGD